MLCAKYQEAGLSGSREKCDRNYLVSKFAYVHNIRSHVKQEVDMPQIQNCVTRYNARRQKWSLYAASAKAGRRHNNRIQLLKTTYNYKQWHTTINNHVQLQTTAYNYKQPRTSTNNAQNIDTISVSNGSQIHWTSS